MPWSSSEGLGIVLWQPWKQDGQLSKENIVWVGRWGEEDGGWFSSSWKKAELSKERNLSEKNHMEKVARSKALSSYAGATVCHS